MTGFDYAFLLARLRQELDELRALRRRFDTCLAAISMPAQDGDAVSARLAHDLAAITAADLPETAQSVWREQVARPLKADPDKPLGERNLAGLRSWPQARVTMLIAALTEIEKRLAEAETDAQNAIVHAEISWEYS